jgi:4-amino-4-deoxy-L-arabinose transferase-like glycosyltransferase
MVAHEKRWAWRLGAVGLIALAAVLRIAYLTHDCPLDLAPDEAHYWDWSRHLDWSYYSKGPLVAYLIRLSCELFGSWSHALIGNEMLAVRLPAVVCGSLLLASIYVLAVQVYSRERWAFAAVGIALTLPLIAAGSSLMTIDAPFTCCWGWALVFGHCALFGGKSEIRNPKSETNPKHEIQNSKCGISCFGFGACFGFRISNFGFWTAAGLCVLAGILAKHTMVLWVPMLCLFLFVTPALRPILWSGRFWWMTTLGALGGLPILIWNMRNGWVTLLHERGHAGMDESLSWFGPLRYLGTQAAVLLGFWFVAWARAAWTHRPGKEPRPEIAYLWWMSVPMIAFFGLFSLRNGGGEPNWPVAGYISGMVLTVGWLANELGQPRPIYRRLAITGIGLTCAVGLLLTALVHQPPFVRPLWQQLAAWLAPDNPRRFDPTCRLRGWHVLAAQVDALVAELRDQGDDVVLACNSWVMPGEIGFYCAGHPDVYSLGLALTDRHSQYDLWHPNPLADPTAFAGKTFLVIGADAAKLKPGFSSVQSREMVRYTENGRALAHWTITIGRGYHGFPCPATDHVY